MVLIANFPVIGIVISYLVVSLSATFISNSFELPFISTNSFTSHPHVKGRQTCLYNVLPVPLATGSLVL